MSDLTKPVDKPHRCDHPDCGVPFKRKSDLKRHGLVHTQLRPYKCEWLNCPKGFNQKGQLKTHMNTHTGEKPNECEMCSKSFGDPASRTRHRKEAHGDQATNQCPVCPSRIKRLGSFLNHLRDKHGIAFSSHLDARRQPTPPGNRTATREHRILRRGACVAFPFDTNTRSELRHGNIRSSLADKHVPSALSSPTHPMPGALGLDRSNTPWQQIPRVISPFHELGYISSADSHSTASASASPRPYGPSEIPPRVDSYSGSIAAESSSRSLQVIHNVVPPNPHSRHHNKYVPLERQLHAQTLSVSRFSQSAGMTLPIDPALLSLARTT